MFASSRFGIPLPNRADPRPGEFGAGEDGESDASRRVTAAVLFPRGRPGAWLLLLAASYAYVIVQASLTRLS